MLQNGMDKMVSPATAQIMLSLDMHIEYRKISWKTVSRVLSFLLCTADIRLPSKASCAGNSDCIFVSVLKTFKLGI